MKPPSDKPNLELALRVAHHPELMSLRYLSYVIGHPLADRANATSPLKRYYWHDETSRRLKFALTQYEPTPGVILKSTFVAHMVNLKDDLADVEHDNGVSPTKYFDQQAHPNIKYSFAPYTTVDFKQPHNVFHVTQAIVSYAGPALGPISEDQLLEGAMVQKAAALEHHKKAHWASAVSALQERIAENPSDAESRLALAEAYVKHSNLNEAIYEYKTVLSQTIDPEVSKKCVQALQDMRVIVGPDGLPEQKTLKLVRHGQSMHQSHDGDNSSLSYGSRLTKSPTSESLVPGYDPGVGF